MPFLINKISEGDIPNTGINYFKYTYDYSQYTGVVINIPLPVMVKDYIYRDYARFKSFSNVWKYMRAYLYIWTFNGIRFRFGTYYKPIGNPNKWQEIVEIG